MVNSCASSIYAIGHAWGTTGEHTNLGKKDVLFLEVVKELVKVWTTKVSDGTQSSEQTLARNLLEMTFADVLQVFHKMPAKTLTDNCSNVNTYKHCCTKIKLVKKLGDKSVDF